MLTITGTAAEATRGIVASPQVPEGAGLRIATRPESPAEGAFEVFVAPFRPRKTRSSRSPGPRCSSSPTPLRRSTTRSSTLRSRAARSASRSASRPEDCADGDAGADLERSRCVKSLVSALGLHGGAGLRITAVRRPGDGHELELTPSAAAGANDQVVRGDDAARRDDHATVDRAAEGSSGLRVRRASAGCAPTGAERPPRRVPGCEHAPRRAKRLAQTR
jgi:hypothetical protein